MWLKLWILTLSLVNTDGEGTAKRNTKHQATVCPVSEFLYQILTCPLDYWTDRCLLAECEYIHASVNALDEQINELKHNFQTLNELVANLKSTEHRNKLEYGNERTNHINEEIVKSQNNLRKDLDGLVLSIKNEVIKLDDEIVKISNEQTNLASNVQQQEMKCTQAIDNVVQEMEISNTTRKLLESKNADTLGVVSKYKDEIETKLKQNKLELDQQLSELKYTLERLTKSLAETRSMFEKAKDVNDQTFRYIENKSMRTDISISESNNKYNYINKRLLSIASKLRNEIVTVKRELTDIQESMERYAINAVKQNAELTMIQNNFRKNMDSLVSSTENKFSELDGGIQTIKDKHTNLVSNLNQQNIKSANAIDQIHIKIVGSNNAIKLLEKKYADTTDIVLENKDEIEIKLKKSQRELELQLTELNTTLKDLQYEKDVLKKNLNETRNLFEELKIAIVKSMLDAETKLKNMVDEAEKELNEKIIKQQKLVNVIYPNTFNKVAVSSVAIIVFIVVCANTFAIIILLKRPASSSVRNAPADRNEDQDVHTSICVLSFDSDTQAHHKTLVASITESLQEQFGPNIPILYHVINQHIDIPLIPRARLTLMFTDFTERHVIIEQRGLGLGDLKRTTYETVRESGGKLVIIYVKDPGSRRLLKNKLYNDNIDCVTSQPELSVLNDHNLFLSVYDNFTKYQRNHLQNIVCKATRSS